MSDRVCSVTQGTLKAVDIGRNIN